MKADFERPCNQRLIIKASRLAVFTASVHCAEGENVLPVWEKKEKLRGTSRPIARQLYLAGLAGRSHFPSMKASYHIDIIRKEQHQCFEGIWEVVHE